MLFFQDDASGLAGSAPGWMPEAGFALLVALVALAAGAVVALWVLVLRLRALEERAGVLGRVEDIQKALARLAQEREDLDLRRIEHLLVDLRETHARLEDALLRAVEAGRAAGGGESSLVPRGGDELGDRVTNRLLALGYERVQIVTRAEKLAELASGGGEVLVEARRQGVLHKGRVLVRAGRIADVEVHPAYSIFP